VKTENRDHKVKEKEIVWEEKEENRDFISTEQYKMEMLRGGDI
jgi:hypothetical protein